MYLKQSMATIARVIASVGRVFYNSAFNEKDLDVKLALRDWHERVMPELLPDVYYVGLSF